MTQGARSLTLGRGWGGRPCRPSRLSPSCWEGGGPLLDPVIVVFVPVSDVCVCGHGVCSGACGCVPVCRHVCVSLRVVCVRVGGWVWVWMCMLGRGGDWHEGDGVLLTLVSVGVVEVACWVGLGNECGVAVVLLTCCLRFPLPRAYTRSKNACHAGLVAVGGLQRSRQQRCASARVSVPCVLACACVSV